MTVGHAEIARRYHDVRRRIAAAAERAGRSPDGVTLVVVTKTRGVDAVRAAIDSGARDLGENYVQEADAKIATLASADTTERPRWHLIGHLQRNKAARAACLFHLIHTVDGLRLGQHLDRAAASMGRRLPVLVEVNVGGERSKAGVTPQTTADLVDSLASLRHVRVDGLMAVPPPTTDPERSRPHFRTLAGLRSELLTRGFDLPHLSMGMTDDYEVAVEEGATIVRVGRAIFGERTR
jgi:pyridoxal phosphate enzyme (YggS family)